MVSRRLDMNRTAQDGTQEQPSFSPKNIFNSYPTKYTGEPNTKICEEAGNLLNAEYGPQQVESILHYVVDYPLDKAMDGAQDTADAVRHLRALKK